jgi:hypothetical protein
MPVSYKWLLSFRFPHQNHLYNCPLPHTCYMTPPSHFSRFDHPKKIGEEYRSLSSFLCSLLHSSVTLSLLGPKKNYIPEYISQKAYYSFAPSKLLNPSNFYFI